MNQKITILAILLTILVVAPVGMATAIVLPEEVTIVEERCEITTDPVGVTVKLMYRYQVEDYHYEDRYGYHYGYNAWSGEFEWHLGPYEKKVHDGWHDEEGTIESMNGHTWRHRWIREERCFIRVGISESPEFDIEANHIYTMEVDGVSVHIDNSLTEAVDYPIFPPVIGIVIMIALGIPLAFWVRGKLEKRQLTQTPDWREREFRGGYYEY